MRTLGKNWQWQLTWELAFLIDEKVKNFWETKEERGKPYLDEWKGKCQEQANTRWNERKKHIETIKDGSQSFRENLLAKIFPS